MHRLNYNLLSHVGDVLIMVFVQVCVDGQAKNKVGLEESSPIRAKWEEFWTIVKKISFDFFWLYLQNFKLMQ